MGGEQFNRPSRVNRQKPIFAISGVKMVSQDLIEILRCPNCVQEKEGLLDFYKETWFICQDCGRKYPVKDDIPVMLIDEGDKWIDIDVEDLPVPPTDK